MRKSRRGRSFLSACYGLELPDLGRFHFVLRMTRSRSELDAPEIMPYNKSASHLFSRIFTVNELVHSRFRRLYDISMQC